MEPNTQSYRAAKRTEIAERRAKVSELYRKNGWTVYRIAKELGCSVATVSEDMGALIAGWQRMAGTNTAAHVALELDKINLLEAEAWESLRLSKLPQRAATAHKSVIPVKNEDGTAAVNNKGQPVTIEESTASANEIHRPQGDPRFMMVINQCITRRMKLYGLEGGRVDEVDEKKNQPTTFTDWVAAHLAKREATSNSLTKAARTAAPRDVTPLPLP